MVHHCTRLFLPQNKRADCEIAADRLGLVGTYPKLHMTASKTIRIDPLSGISLIIQSRVKDQPLGTSTGFCIVAKSKTYLITNRHVVTGRDSDTGQVLSPTGAVPEEFLITHHGAGRLGTWVIKSEKLYDADQKPRWVGHPFGGNIDVIALPLNNLGSDVAIYPLDLALANTDVRVQVAMPVSIVGFPLGLSIGGAWPIWKTGHVASDPDIDHDGKPVFLIDATTRGGMSGSPVILRLFGGYETSAGNYILSGGQATKFLGIYSGRLHDQSEIGRVFRPSVISDILETAP